MIESFTGIHPIHPDPNLSANMSFDQIMNHVNPRYVHHTTRRFLILYAISFSSSLQSLLKLPAYLPLNLCLRFSHCCSPCRHILTIVASQCTFFHVAVAFVLIVAIITCMVSVYKVLKVVMGRKHSLIVALTELTPFLVSHV